MRWMPWIGGVREHKWKLNSFLIIIRPESQTNAAASVPPVNSDWMNDWLSDWWSTGLVGPGLGLGWEARIDSQRRWIRSNPMMTADGLSTLGRIVLIFGFHRCWCRHEMQINPREEKEKASESYQRQLLKSLSSSSSVTLLWLTISNSQSNFNSGWCDYQFKFIQISNSTEMKNWYFPLYLFSDIHWMTNKTNGLAGAKYPPNVSVQKLIFRWMGNIEEKKDIRQKTTTPACARNDTNLIAAVAQDNNSVAIKMRNYRKTIKEAQSLFHIEMPGTWGITKDTSCYWLTEWWGRDGWTDR